MALESCFWIPERQVFTQGREYARAWWGTVCPATLDTQILCVRAILPSVWRVTEAKKRLPISSRVQYSVSVPTPPLSPNSSLARSCEARSQCGLRSSL
jgi:hypothetical protein